jgi:putative membrane protein
MTQFQNLWSNASEKLKPKGNEQSSSGKDEDATMKAAGKVAQAAGHHLSKEQKKKAGPIIHYAFGTGMGALYGTVVEVGPRKLRRHDLLSGVGLGGVLFAGVDEIAVPALGLSKKPTEAPLSSHLYALASHLIYGLTTGAVRKAVRAAL